MNRPRIFPHVYYGYWVLAISFLCLVVMNGIVGYSFSLYVKPLSAEFGWSRAAIMAGATISFLVMGLSAPLVGRAVSRLGARKVIPFGALILGLSYFFLSNTHELWQFYISYTLTGIGAGSMGMVPTSMVISDWFRERRGLAIGILGSGIGVGGFFMPLLVGAFFIPTLGWRASYLLSGILIASLIIPLSILVIRTRPSDMGHIANELSRPDKGNKNETATSNLPERGLNLKEALRTRTFWLMVVAFATFSFANASIMQNHVPHLQDIQIPTAIAATALSAVGIGSAIGKFGFGWLCDFIQSKYTLVIGICCQITSVLILMNMKSTSSVVSIWLYAGIFGLGIGSWLPAMSMTVSNIFGMASYGVIFGMMNLIFGVGGSLGPVVAGMIYDANQSYFWAFIMSFSLYAVSMPAILMVRRPKR